MIGFLCNNKHCGIKRQAAHCLKKKTFLLYYLLNEEPESMVNRFLWTQTEKRNLKDWTTNILKDLEEFNLKLTLEEIKT